MMLASEAMDSKGSSHPTQEAAAHPASVSSCRIIVTLYRSQCLNRPTPGLFQSKQSSLVGPPHNLFTSLPVNRNGEAY